MLPAYIGFLEAENTFLRAELARCKGITGFARSEPMKVAIREPWQTRKNHCMRTSTVYTAIWRPPRASKVKTVEADEKTLAERLEESAEQLHAAGVLVADDVTVEEVVELYMRAPGNPHKALRIHAASKLVPNTCYMMNDEKIAAVNQFKTHIKAAVSDLAFGEQEAKDVTSMMLKAVVDHMGITKGKKHR